MVSRLLLLALALSALTCLAVAVGRLVPASQTSDLDIGLLSGESQHDFGSVGLPEAGMVLKHQFSLKNVFHRPLSIRSVDPPAGSPDSMSL